MDCIQTCLLLRGVQAADHLNPSNRHGKRYRSKCPSEDRPQCDLDGVQPVVFPGWMYAPEHFAESDPTVLRDAVRRIRAGELITVGSEGLEASFIPLLISDDAGTVTGHLAKANGQWKRADLSMPALATWVGPDAYVSPSYYPSKQDHGRVVPTWNFITVQARGELSLHEDDEWKRSHVESLTNFHEGALPAPWSVDDAPSDFIDGLVKAIVGIELRVTAIEGKWKLSQNRPEPDLAGVISGLESLGLASAACLAQEMAHVRDDPSD